MQCWKTNPKCEETSVVYGNLGMITAGKMNCLSKAGLQITLHFWQACQEHISKFGVLPILTVIIYIGLNFSSSPFCNFYIKVQYQNAKIQT